MRKYDYILWDLDGTLLDFLLSERYALRVCLAAHGVEMTEEMLAVYSKINEGYWKRLEKGEVTKQELLPGRFRDFFAQMGITHIDPVALQERYQIELGTETYYIDQSYELLCKLKEQGFKQYIVTNGVIATQAVKMRNSGFDQIVDGIFISDELGYEKPRKEFFDAAFAQLSGFDKKQAILIGDSPTSDIKGANNAEITACWYNPNGKELPEGVHTEFEIASLYELHDILGME